MEFGRQSNLSAKKVSLDFLLILGFASEGKKKSKVDTHSHAMKPKIPREVVPAFDLQAHEGAVLINQF